MYTILSKCVRSDGSIAGIYVTNGHSLCYVKKSDFVNVRNTVGFTNGKISVDGRVLQKDGEYPIGIKSIGAENIITLYHSSSDIVKNPLYGYGNKSNDYGLGFYCTKDYNLAAEWACKNGVAWYVNKYEIDYSILNILDLTGGSYKDIMTWLAILIENRVLTAKGLLVNEAKSFIREKYLPRDYRNYDLIRGYRADDSYFSYASGFISGAISYEKLSNAIFLGELGVQEVLISRLAFYLLEYKGSEMVDEKYVNRYAVRDSSARSDYARLQDSSTGTTIMSMMRRGY